MTVKEEVLRFLQEASTAISGEEIAEKLKVSRNTIWKAVRQLRKEGYGIEAVTNLGYRLVSEGNVLNVDNIRRCLKGNAKEVLLDVRDSVSSTNTVLKEIGEKGGLSNMVVIADTQTAGRGRLGRRFASPKGSGLYLSILLHPEFSPEESLSITTMAAVAVAEAIEAQTDKTAKIKWVNDVYVDTYKVCGILTEAAIDFESRRLNYVVLGIGINILEPKGGYPSEIKEIAGALYRSNCPDGLRTRLAAEVLNRFYDYYGDLLSKKHMDSYRERSLLTGIRITFQCGNELYHGVVKSIDDAAQLVVLLDDGRERSFSTGEIVVEKDFLVQMRKENQEE